VWDPRRCVPRADRVSQAEPFEPAVFLLFNSRTAPRSKTRGNEGQRPNAPIRHAGRTGYVGGSFVGPALQILIQEAATNDSGRDRGPWTVDHAPQMQNAKPTTRFFPDESGLRFAQLPSHCPLPPVYCLLITGNWQLPTRRATQVGVPATAVYTGGHPLEKDPKSLTLSHFSARPE
jgi:hypothetical protein